VKRSRRAPRKANQALARVLGGIAAAREATKAQIALAWLLTHKPWIAPGAHVPAGTLS
jgi:aryl-alcohol dehydrogenase-like predicted oxidoreductase